MTDTITTTAEGMTDPAIFNGVIPYISVEGADAAATFYKKAFAAEELRRLPAPDGKRLMHCHLKIHGGSLMMSDAFPEYGRELQTSHSFLMTLVVDDADLWWNRAVEAGCDIVSALKIEFWGDYYGELKDPFGIRWAINSPVKQA